MKAGPLLAISGAAALMGNAAPLKPERPVMIGGRDDLDACLTVSKVTGLNPRGDNFLSLRSQPSSTARELSRLRPEQQVWVCEETPGGWTGVLVAPADGSLDCGVGTPIARRQAYSGTCQSGWVASRFLKVIAG
ncbi:SH3 domain-containing protein [Novosphingobium sp. G106]|uniref:SH3 domain-containing protein n=1 Tax=Novosphingobium sp. G106 TaxID=2849500 RepID=UPI001C2DBF4A|nr:SH3 domain-containing protein [Novosphingobium sp. G106]MBV1690502.1 SH3 domain-containing protein [Novosphingobium sp. G106]